MTAVEAASESAFDVALPARPYPGLRPFTKAEWPIFFGRERMVDAVVDLLIQQRFLVLHGASGSGKSSLIRAGVLPRLEQQAARGGTRWLTCTVTPGDAPLLNLAQALAELSGQTGDDHVLEFRRILNCGDESAAMLTSMLKKRSGTHVCILLDQFEELFTHARRHGRQQASLLIELLNSLHRLSVPELCVVLTMRSEFLGACAEFDGFAETVNATQHLLPKMNQADLMRAIREPATLYEGEVSAELARRLISDAGGGQDQLPLIQHGLLMLHAAKLEAGGGPSFRLSLSDYKAKGGLAQLLSDHADQVASSALELAGDTHPNIVEVLFRALTEVTPDGCAIRRPQRLSDLLPVVGADEHSLRRVIDAFRAEGVSFLRPYGREAYSVYDYIDLSHEALIRSWRSLSDPCDGWLFREFKDGLIWRSLLVQAESFERDSSSVLSPAATEERTAWLARHGAAWCERYAGGWGRVQALMAASVKARDEQQREKEEARQRKADEAIRDLERRAQARRLQEQKQFSAVLLTLLVLAIGLAWFAFQKSKQATHLAEVANAQRDEAVLARQDSEQRRGAAERTATQIAADVDLVRLAAVGTNSEVKDEIDRYANSISKQLVVLEHAARQSPRVYLQIANESQREAATLLRARISRLKIDDTVVVGVSVELHAQAPNRAELRCFGGQDCEAGKRLLALINAELVSPKLQLHQLPATKSARPLHFELWFGQALVVLRASDPAAPPDATAE